MPELPEVETIVNDLKKVLPALKIRDFWTDFAKAIKNPKTLADFKKQIKGRKILKLERKGKNILIHLDKNLTLLVHQKMTGHLLYGKWTPAPASDGARVKEWMPAAPGPIKDDPENRFIHFVWSLSNNKQLALCDMRKFAKILLWPTGKLDKLPDIKNLGPDPLDEKFDFKKFKEAIKNKKGRIKSVLMDQKIIAGIGNIYSDEILWRARMHPLKQTKNLSEKDFKSIYSAIKPVLKRAIRARGSSYIDYRDTFGRKGRYQEMHYAYQMTGTKCLKKDGGIIKKIKIGGRSAHFCPVHQKL
jgi:formamidopyrimidine-DNA glycosylase